MSDTDVMKELVQKATAGDKAAFEELYRATYRSVYYTCLGLLKDEHEAQDITQDVYLAVFGQLGTLEDASKFKSWLYRIAANKSIKHLRKKQPTLLGNEQLEDLETEENENFLPEEYALNADKRKLVLEITRKVCTDVQYQSILLYYFNELSIAEIAEIMECLEGTVKNRLSVARSKIKEGVLRYEKKSGDKLHSFAAIPFLTTLFTAQMQDMPMPSLPLSFKGAFPKSTLAAKAAKTGGRVMLKSLQMKIIAGIVAGVVAAGGVTAAVVITNQNAEQTSAGGLEGSTLDVADGGGGNQQAASGNGENTAGGNAETTPEPTEAPHEHNYAEEITVEATCETDGVKTFTCECGDSYTEAIAATGHVFNYVYNEDATYLADGTETATCENCDETDTRTAEGTMLTYTYADMSATKYAKQTVNVRTLPSTDGEKIGALSTNDEITITGQCNETGWYRFEYNGQTAYVFADYVGDNKVEVAQSNSGGSSTASLVSADGTIELNGTVYPVRTWIDMGNWFLYIEPDLVNPRNNSTAWSGHIQSRGDGSFGCDQHYTLLDRGYSVGMNSTQPIYFSDGRTIGWELHESGYSSEILKWLKNYLDRSMYVPSIFE